MKTIKLTQELLDNIGLHYRKVFPLVGYGWKKMTSVAKFKLEYIELSGGVLFVTHPGKSFAEDYCLMYKTRGEFVLVEYNDFNTTFLEGIIANIQHGMEIEDAINSAVLFDG